MSVQGPIARRVLDLRIALEIMSRPSTRDPWYAPIPFAGPPLANPIRVAFATDPGGRGVDAAVAAGVRAAADVLADAGYTVEEVELPVVSEAAELWFTLVLTEVRGMWPLLEAVISDGARRFLEDALTLVPPIDQAEYAAAFVARQGLARTWTEFQAHAPLVLGPVATQLPFAVGADLEGTDAVDALRGMLDLTVLCNCLGLPAVAMPTGTDGGLPLGAQIIGPRYREDLCLTAAWELERALGTLTPIDPRR